MRRMRPRVVIATVTEAKFVPIGTSIDPFIELAVSHVGARGDPLLRSDSTSEVEILRGIELRLRENQRSNGRLFPNESKKVRKNRYDGSLLTPVFEIDEPQSGGEYLTEADSTTAITAFSFQYLGSSVLF